MLLSKGYPDIGWNPCGGEKYLDFLRFAVFVNGVYESLWCLCLVRGVEEEVTDAGDELTLDPKIHSFK